MNRERSLSREVIGTQIPSGDKQTLAVKSRVFIHQTLGGSYEDIDITVKQNDQMIFRNYVTAGKDAATVREMFEKQYKGFDEAGWQQVLLWNSTEP